jgi:hypothetical protein
MLDDRHLKFAEDFANVEVTGNWRGRTALAGEVAEREFLVDFGVQRFFAVLGAGVLRPY